MYNDGTVSDLNEVLLGIEEEDVTEAVDEDITGLSRRIECAKIGNELKREGYAEGREIKREYLDVVKDDIFPEYKEETSDNGI